MQIRTNAREVGRLVRVRLELGGLETLQLPLALEVVPPPSIGSEENSTAPKSPIASDVDNELTLTEAVMPRLIRRQQRERPAHQPLPGPWLPPLSMTSRSPAVVFGSSSSLFT